MAVHAQYLAHAFPHDPRAITCRPAMDNAATASSVFLVGEPGNAAFSNLTYNYNHNHDDGGCVAPSKRARLSDVAGARFVADLEEAQRALPPPLFPAPGAVDVRSRSAAASTSGRPAGAAPQGLLLSHLYRHGVEVDALIRIENERLRVALSDARRRHVSAAASAAARRLRAAEAELARALARNTELDERLRQAAAEGRAWEDAARSHEAAAARLRAALDDLLIRQPPPCSTGAEGDAESCCFESRSGSGSGSGGGSGGGARGTRASCRSCGEAEACVLLLPCRHMCLCRGCEAGAEACPVCFAARNASLHVLLLPRDGQ